MEIYCGFLWWFRLNGLLLYVVRLIIFYLKLSGSYCDILAGHYTFYALILIFKNPPEDSYSSKRKFESIEIFEVRSDLLLNNAANNLELRIRFCLLRK